MKRSKHNVELVQKFLSLNLFDKSFMHDFDELLLPAKQWLLHRLLGGENCPLCGQMAKAYPRNLYYSEIKSLIKLFQLDENVLNAFHHHSKFWSGYGNDYAKMALFKLIEPAMKDIDSDKRTSGMWRITQRGRDFVLGKITLPKYVWTYDSQIIGFSGDQVTLQDCLGEKFSYNAVMGITTKVNTKNLFVLESSFRE